VSAARVSQDARERVTSRLIVVMMTSAVIVTIAVMPVIVVLRVVARLIFSGLHEIHRSLARMVFVAVLAPILGVARRYVQVDGLDRRGANHDW
jgi:hypothetical protein